MNTADYQCFICEKIVNSDDLDIQRNHMKTHKKSELLSLVKWRFVDKQERTKKAKKDEELEI